MPSGLMNCPCCDVRRRYLVIGANPIDPPTGGAAIRTRQHIEILRRNHNVKYWTPRRPEWASLSLASRIRQAPRVLDPRHDAYANYVYDPKRSLELCAYASKYKPDVIVVSELYMYRYAKDLRQILPRAEIVFDAHNHETTLHQAISGKYRQAGIKRTENAMLDLADRLWVCSEIDAKAFGVECQVIPNGINDTGIRQPGSPYTLGYIGGYDYRPNLEAAQALIHDILPRLPETYRIILLGKHPQPFMSTAWSYAPGKANTLTPWLDRIGIMCMPIKSGSGTRLKVIEALSAGKPIIATEKAVEGIPIAHDEHAIICTIDDMPREIIRLSNDAQKLEQLRRNGRLFATKYHWERLDYD